MKRGAATRLGLAVVLFVGLIAMACGGGKDDEGAGTSGAGSPAAGIGTPAPAQATAASEINPNATLRFAFGTNGGSNYDPHTAANPFVNSFLYPAYDSLIVLSADGKLEPQLA